VSKSIVIAVPLLLDRNLPVEMSVLPMWWWLAGLARKNRPSGTSSACRRQPAANQLAVSVASNPADAFTFTVPLRGRTGVGSRKTACLSTFFPIPFRRRWA
jgi:hypothetical protein